MTEQKEFVEELARVPDLPGELFESVHRNLQHQKTMRRVFISLAATLVLAVGLVATMVSTSDHGTLSAEVASELLFINDYGSGHDITRDVENYALYNDEMSD